MGGRPGGLWRNREFLKLWAGQSVSLAGSQVTLLALPLTAVLALHASAVQMGVLGAAQVVPALVVGLVAGAWADRLRRRPILIAADLGRAAVLASIPLTAFLGVLHIEQLYAVAFLTGAFSTFFSAAYVAVLPSLVPRESLAEGNGKLATSRSAAQSVGPGLAGALVQLFSAPFAILVDAFSFLVSVFSLCLIRVAEPAAPAGRRSLWREIGEGFVLVRQSPLLRALAAFAASFNFFGQLVGTLYILYVTRDLSVRPALLGGILAVLGVSGILGAMLTGRISARFGLGRTIAVSAVVAAAANLFIPLASVSPVGPLPPLIVQEVFEGFSVAVLQVVLVTLEQASAPSHLQGRLTATISFLFAGTMPVGALLAGGLGGLIGLRPTLVAGSAGMLLASLWVVGPSVRNQHQPPALVGVPSDP